MTYYRYVRHGEMLWRLATGWRFCCELMLPHGEWSVLMEWAGEGEAP